MLSILNYIDYKILSPLYKEKTMKLKLISYLLFLLSYSLWGETLHMSSKSVNFGTVVNKDKNTKTITIYNKFRRNLKIDSIPFDDQKLFVSYDKKIIPPGDSATVSISLQEMVLQSLEEYAIAVYTNHGYEIVLISGKIESGFEFERTVYDNIRLLRHDTLNLVVKLTTSRMTKHSFTLAKEHKYVSDLLVEQFDSSYVLTFKLVTLDKKRDFSEIITINTGIEEWPEIQLPVSGKIVPLIELSKTEVNFGKISKKKKHRDLVEVTFNKGTDFNVTKQKTVPNHALVSVVKKQGRKWFLYFTIYPHSPLGKFHGYTFLYLNNSETPQIAVSITGEVVE